jgi:hypothetical protein
VSNALKRVPGGKPAPGRTNRSIGDARGTLDRAGVLAGDRGQGGPQAECPPGSRLCSACRGRCHLRVCDDAPIRKDQAGVVFTMATEIPTTFHVAVVVGTAEARRFVGYVRSPPGQAILVRRERLPP